MENIFSKYNKILVFDTETTGISCKYHEIIQFSSVMAEMTEYGMVVSDSLDLLITLSPGKTVPPEITKLTGITQQDIDARGVSNSHQAQDDALAAARLMEVMEQEKQDLISYVNLFGYNPKYGVPRPPIRSITYKPQYYNPAAPLYL